MQPKELAEVCYRSLRNSMLCSAVVWVALAGAYRVEAQETCNAELEICFQGIGDLPGGLFLSNAKGIAYVDGTVVVVGISSSTRTEHFEEAVMFSAGRLRPLFPTPTLALRSSATDVAVVGSTIYVTGAQSDAISWPVRFKFEGDVLVAFHQLPFPQDGSPLRIGNSISDDGKVIVGTTAANSAFRWDESTTTTLLPKLNPGAPGANNRANGVSPNGLIAVGGSTAQAGFEGFWFPIPGFPGPVGMGDLPGGSHFSEAYAVSDSGIAVGSSSTSAGTEAFRCTPWTFVPIVTSGVMTSLGDLPGGSTFSHASAISGDGRTVVGFGTDFSVGQKAIVWHPDLGLRDLQEFMEAELGARAMSGWKLSRANAIATNGLAIAGVGLNPARENEGWYVTLPDCNDNGQWDGLEPHTPFTRTPRSVISFDGTNDLLENPSPADALRITGDLTIEAWIYLHRLGVTQSVITLGEAGQSLPTNVLYTVEIDANGDLRAAHERSDLSTVAVLADTNLRTGRWYHLAVVRKMFSTTLLEYSVYVDDREPLIEGAVGRAAGGSAGRLRIGRAEGTTPFVPDRPFDGFIADVRVWNVERSADQIRASTFTSTPVDTTGLVASWRIDEPSGDIITDSLGSNHLAVMNGPSRVTVGTDCNRNRIPDSCEADCNENGVADACEIRDGDRHDCDANGRLDECDAADALAALLNVDQAATEFFRTERENQRPTTFGTMIANYGRPWQPVTGQTPGGGDPTMREPAERLRMLLRDPSCLPTRVAQRVLEEFFGFEMLLGNEAFADAMDPTVGEGTQDEPLSLEQVPGMFAFRGLPRINTLLDEELALLRGREIPLPASSHDPLSDEPASNINGNYPLFGTERAAIYNRLRPNATDTLGSVGYRSNYGKTNNAEAALAFPQGHGDAYGYYLTATKAYLDVFGAAKEQPAPVSFSQAFVESLSVAKGSTDCGDQDCEVIVDDDGITHHVGFQSVRNMVAAMAARARTVNRIVDLTFRRDYREDADTRLTDTDASRAWGMADWARRGATGAYFDWAAANHLLPMPQDNAGDDLDDVHRRRIDELRILASAVDEMQERVDAAGAGLNPQGLFTNVVPFRIIQPGQLLDFLQGGSSAGQSHYGIVRNAALEAIKNARGILRRANVAANRLRGNEEAFADFENQVLAADIGFNDRLIEIFGLPSASDTSDNDFEDNDADGVQSTGGINDPDDDFIEAGCDGECAGAPDLQNPLIDAQAQQELGWVDRAAVGQVQLSMFELRTAVLRVQMAELAVSNLEALIADKAENVAAHRREAVEELEIQAQACDERKKVIDRKRELAEARGERGFFSKASGLFTSAALCAGTGGAGCAPFLEAQLGFLNEALGEMASGSDPVSEIQEQFDIEREELRINCWQTAELTQISNDQQIRALEIELEDLIRKTPQAILEMAVAETQARQAFAVVRKSFQQGKRLLDERDRNRRVQTDKLQNFRFRDMAFRTFRNQALEQYGAFFDLAARYVMLAGRAFAYEYNERDEVSEQMRRLHREQLLGTESAADQGLQSIIARLDQKRQESDFLARLQKLSLFDHGGDEFSLRKNLLGLAINPSEDTDERQFEKNKAFRAFLESNIVQNLIDVPAFRQLASFDSNRDAGPAIVLAFATEVGGQTLFGQRRGTTFGAPANFDTCSNPRLFEFAILLEGVDNPSALGVDSRLIFAHFLPVGSCMLREPESGDCALRSVRNWAVVDQRIPGVSAAYRDSGGAILDSFAIPRLATSPDLNVINRFPVTQAQIRATDQPVFQDDLAGWSVWNTQWLLAIPGRQFANPADDVDVVRKKLLILIFDANEGGNPRGPDENLGIDDIKLRIKAYGKPS